MKNFSIILLVSFIIVLLLTFYNNKEGKLYQERELYQNPIIREKYQNPIHREIKEFCGVSTYGKCFEDSECIRSGCSSHVCQSIYERGIITTCEWLECYDASKYGLSCKCINNACQWA